MPQHKSLVFYFTFYDEDAKTETTFGFIARDPAALYTQLKVPSFAGFTEVLYDLATEELESEYGVHDWSSRPTSEVDAIGYTTYEVGVDQVGPLMAAWRKWFSNNAGNPTEVIQVSKEAAQGDDSAVYAFIAAACKSKTAS